MKSAGWRIALFLMVVVVGVSSGGCWDNVDPRNRAFVTAIGLDLGPDPLLEVTFQIPVPGQLRSKGGGGGGGGDVGKVPFLTVTGHGRTFTEAKADAQAHMDRELYLSQANLIVFGRALVEKGLRPVVYELARMPEIVTCYFATAEQARDVITFVPKWEPIPGVYIRSFYESVDTKGRYLRVPLWKVDRDLSTPGLDPVLPVLDVTGGQIGFGGAAVLRDDRLAGFLDPLETRGLAWMLGTVRNETVTVEVNGSPYSLRRVEAATRLQVHRGQTRPAARATIRVSGELAAATPRTDSSSLARLEAALERFVADEIRRTMDHVEAMGSDPVRFEARLRDQEPWLPESAGRFRSLPWPRLTLEIQAHIYGMGMRR
jgi:spore germination protein KC